MSKFNRLEGKALQAAKLSTAEINAFDGSVRSGKTVGTLWDFAKFCIDGPEGLFVLAGRTQRTVINNLILPLQEMLGKSMVQIKFGSGTAVICGREVLLVGANNEQARTKIQGLTLAGAYADEVATLPESFFDMLYSRLSIDGARMWCTCNPEGPHHWFKKKWLDRAKLWLKHDGTIEDKRDLFEMLDYEDPKRPINLHRFSFLLDDNKNLSAEYVAGRKASYSGLFYQRMILGQWALADGVIYSDFDEPKHVIPHDELPRMERVFGVGVDHGMTNATAGIMVGLAAVDGFYRLYLMDEWAPPKATPAEHSEMFKAWLKPHKIQPEWIFIDPAAEVLAYQFYQDGVGRTAHATNSHDGIQTIASLFKLDRIRISDRCTNFLRELPGYVWDSKASDKGKDTVVKIDDHFMDAGRYGLISPQKLWETYIPLTSG
ncbi:MULTISPECIES: PBSX family phage terminase large subunit [Rhodococcus]|uniref:PBSX family phage terminase large subunit n=1 Tax=Rhodococcus TaxID=1827 RepID=UPI0007AE9C4E|nr:MULTISPECIES: PBSX family phage terminase large subunit [Rhodococcus]KZL33215.1 hypothetical protein A3852_13045 [Rhodococcus qingshengii]MCE4161625.1 PBSX family phage terminase large subunit [Rhodococcus sp. Ni2]